MTEQIDLATPITEPATAFYRVMSFTCDWENARVNIYLKDTVSGKREHFEYVGPVATALMVLMNKKNFTTVSMQKTILNKLITDGYLVGTVSGSPD